MITVLTGSNSFLVRQVLVRKKSEFVAEHGDLALEQFEGETASFDMLQGSLESLPFLASKKLVIITDLSANKQAADDVEKLLANISETTELVIVETKLDKRTAYYKWLKKHTDFQEFTELDERKLAAWAVEYTKEQGGSLSQADANYLVNRVGPNQQRLSQEIQKLTLASAVNLQGQSLQILQIGVIGREVIDELTEATPQSKIFDLLDAAFQGQAKRALEIYREQRSLRVEPQEILAMIGWQLRQVALAKTAGTHDLVREGKVSPYSASKAKAIAGRLSLRHLKQLIQDLTSLDARSKRMTIDLDEALQNYLLRLA